MKDKTRKILSYLDFFLCLSLFLGIIKYSNELLNELNHNIKIYTIVCLSIGILLWDSFITIYNMNKNKPCSNCKCKKNLDVNSFKKDFWLWLKNNTNFYVCRNHHKENIDNAIEYCICKRINDLEEK